nr:hypothetical protein BaRGS_023029 [Batillaria attramentaria]
MSSVTSPTTTDSGVGSQPSGNTTSASNNSSPAKNGGQETDKVANPETGEPAAGGGHAGDGDKHEQTAEEILSRSIAFRPFTEESYRLLVEREEVDKVQAKDRASKAQEAHLVDGELIFGAKEDDEAEKPPEVNPDLREGNILTDNYGIFPTNLCGKPLEEIDKGIRDKVRKTL